MKVAIIGSRNLTVDNLGDYLPWDVDEILTGGAKGIDTCAANYAEANGIKLTVIKPEYDRYRKGAPLKRNRQLIENSDCFIAFWDGKSRGTMYALTYATAYGANGVVYLYRGGRYRLCLDADMWMDDELSKEYDEKLRKELCGFADELAEQKNRYKKSSP